MAESKEIVVNNPYASDRLTFITSVIHTSQSASPVVVDCRRSIRLEHKEQPYSRRITVKPTWDKLDLGWVEPDQVGFIVIQNQEGRALGLQPSPEEAKSIESKIILVSFGLMSDQKPHILIPSGCCSVFLPSSPTIFLRSENGNTQAELTIFNK